MSKDQGGPPPGPPSPPPARYGPGKTLVAQPAYVEEVARAGSVSRSPPTVRELPVFVPGAPPPPYGAPPPNVAPPHAAPHPYNHAPQMPYGVPPLPQARASASKPKGPSLLVIGGISAVVIGTVTTLIAIRLRPTSDDKPAPTIELPAPASVSVDSPEAAASSEREAPSAASGGKPPPAIKPTSSRPARPTGPGPGPRTPPPRHGP